MILTQRPILQMRRRVDEPRERVEQALVVQVGVQAHPLTVIVCISQHLQWRAGYIFEDA